MTKTCILINGPIRAGVEDACKVLKHYINYNENNIDIYITTWKSNDENKYNEEELKSSIENIASINNYNFKLIDIEKDTIYNSDKNTIYLCITTQPLEKTLNDMNFPYPISINYEWCPYKNGRFKSYCMFYSMYVILTFIKNNNIIYNKTIRTRIDLCVTYYNKDLDLSLYNTPITFWTDRFVNDHTSISSFNTMYKVWANFDNIDSFNKELADIYRNSHDPENILLNLTIRANIKHNEVSVKYYKLSTVEYIKDGCVNIDYIKEGLKGFIRYKSKIQHHIEE